VADAVIALKNAQERLGLYTRSGSLIRLRQDRTGRTITERITKSITLWSLAQAATWVFPRENGEMRQGPPPEVVAEAVLAMGAWPFPELEGVVEAPTMRPDGTILDVPGYDSKIRLFFSPAPGLAVPPVGEFPSEDDLARARALIDELFVDFPFDGESSKANALGLLLTPVLRPMISGPVPLALIDKPSPGTGASLLAEVVSIITTGRRAEFLSPPKDDEEARKLVTSILLSGTPLAVLDNADRTIAAASLSRMLTASTWRDRLLGRNIAVSVPQRTVWAVTGNNLQIGGDLGRRSYLIRLDARIPRPWTRTGFRHPDLLGWVAAHRGELLSALLAFVRAWVAAGSPSAEVPVMGGFEEWTQIVGGVLAHGDVKGFLDNREHLYEQVDEAHAGWEAFLRRWREEFNYPITVAELIKRIESSSEFREAIPASPADAFTGERPNTRRIGVALRQRVDIRFAADGLRIERAPDDTHRGHRHWQVVVDTPAPETTPTDSPADDDGRRRYALDLARALGFPRLRFVPGREVAEGEPAYVAFLTQATDPDVDLIIEALQALDAETR